MSSPLLGPHRRMEFIPIEQAQLVVTTKYESCYVCDSTLPRVRHSRAPERSALYAPTSFFEIKELPLSFEQTFPCLVIPFFSSSFLLRWSCAYLFFFFFFFFFVSVSGQFFLVKWLPENGERLQITNGINWMDFIRPTETGDLAIWVINLSSKTRRELESGKMCSILDTELFLFPLETFKSKEMEKNIVIQ